MTVEDMITDVLRREGGFSNDPADRGGATNMGITRGTLSAYYGRPATVDEVRGLTPELAREIYRRIYLDGPGIHTMPAPIQAVLFDAAVNSGPRRSVTWLQEVLNFAGYGPLQADGAIGPKTRAAAEKAIAEMGAAMLQVCLIEQRRGFLEQLMRSDPSQERFRKGWLRRLLELMRAAAAADPGDQWIAGRVRAYEQDAA